jgi:hypothetical protein
MIDDLKNHSGLPNAPTGSTSNQLTPKAPYKPALAKTGVKAITEELCGHSFSASSISAIHQRLDASLAQFAGRPLAEVFPYLMLDARYERVRDSGIIVSQAVLIAIGIDWDGRRQVLAVELANRESRSSWRDSCSGSRPAVCTASSLSSPMITRGSERHCARFWRKRPTSAVTCIS